MKRVKTDQYDSPWKEAIEEYFQECLAFFFPKIHADIDWAAGYQFLDKELEKVVRQAIVTENSNSHFGKHWVKTKACYIFSTL